MQLHKVYIYKGHRFEWDSMAGFWIGRFYFFRMKESTMSIGLPRFKDLINDQKAYEAS